MIDLWKKYGTNICVIVALVAAICLMLYFFAGIGQKKIAAGIEKQEIIKQVDEVKIRQDEKQATEQKTEIDSLKKISAATEQNARVMSKNIEATKKRKNDKDITIIRVPASGIDSLLSGIKTEGL